MSRLLRYCGFMCLSVGIVVTQALAQGDCPALVTQALTALDANCEGLGRNTACYGYNRVSASFIEAVADDYFAVPSDTTAIDILEEIQTTAMDVALDQWGVAIMSVQASLPDSLPGQSLTFVLLGDTQVSNAVAPENAFQPATAIEVVTNVDANIRSGAGTNFNALGAVDSGTTLSADALNADGTWVRVAYAEKPAWVFRELLNATPEIDVLPVLDGNQRTPMQAFYLRTGVGDMACAEAPQDTLMVQGPKGIKVDLTANGAHIRIGSTVLFNTPAPDVLEITVLDGEAVVVGGGENGDDLEIPSGYTSQACLSDDENGNPVVSCAFGEPTKDSNEEMAEWCGLEGVPATLLAYAVNVRCPGDPETTQTNTATGGGGGGTCPSFNIISPLNGSADFVSQTFSWTAISGADQYALNFFDSAGNFMTGQFVDASQTSTTIFTGTFADSFFSWQVHALKGGQIFCSTGRTATLARSDNPSAPPPATGGVPSLKLICSGANVGFTWNNFLPGATFSYSWSPGSSGGASGGSGTVMFGTYYIYTANISASTGENYSFGSKVCP
jgi:hypothetical protein